MDEAKYKSLILLIVVLAGMTLIALLGAVAPKQELSMSEAKGRLISYILLSWVTGLVALFFLHKLLTE